MKNQPNNIQTTLYYYNNYTQKFIESTRYVNFQTTQDKFLSYLKNNASILDFGCGSGRDTKYFLGHGYNVTAIDGSKEICIEAAKYTEISVKQMLFEELEEEAIYDGIWACASILHLPKKNLENIFGKMSKVLKKEGVIYISFKYGTIEGKRNDRYFTDFIEEIFTNFISKIPQLQMKEMWITGDVRKERGDERWLNIMLQKTNTY